MENKIEIKTAPEASDFTAEVDDEKNWTRLKSDINGNSRFVTSWDGYGFNTYAEAVKAANQIGGRRYHTKHYGGGLVFQSIKGHLPYLKKRLISIAAEINKTNSKS